MSDIAIACEGVSKRYRIGERERYRTLRETITRALSPRRLRPERDDFIWALDDVSFQLQRGDVLGVIGRNGAGKSTLLKILSRITKPTRGRALIRGRVGSLLEVGTGFHPELTGRENIYLNGAILGMKRREIARRFDEIVAFAEIDRFLDTPVKRYSSGMYMRLAFAVAAHLEPEILVIDEVLAVGDAAFQKKCLGRMGDVAKSGRTVLLVSHNMVAVQSVCRTALWFDRGKIVAEGPAGEVCTRFLQDASSRTPTAVWDRDSAPGNEFVRVRRVAVRPKEGVPSDPITVRTPLTFEIEYWNAMANASVVPSAILCNGDGTAVFDSGPTGTQQMKPGLYRGTCNLPGDLLNDGQYTVNLNFVRDEQDVVFHLDRAATFEVFDSAEMRGSWYGRWHGVIRPQLEWRLVAVEADE